LAIRTGGWVAGPGRFVDIEEECLLDGRRLVRGPGLDIDAVLQEMKISAAPPPRSPAASRAP